MNLGLAELTKILVIPGHLTEEQLTSTADKASKSDTTISEQLIEDGLILDKDLGQAVADFYNNRFVNLQVTDIEEKNFELIPEIVARAQRAVVYAVSDQEIVLATEQLENYEFFRLLEKKTLKEVKALYATTRGINHALKHYKGDLHDRITEAIDSCATNLEEAGVVNLVNLFLEYANDNGASDIHIEPLEKHVLVRFRVDGMLHEAVHYPTSLHEKVVFRIKIMSHLQTDERAAPQDGRFEYEHGEDSLFDVRVSILPITYGENIVMRLLDRHTHRYSLENLGLSENDYKKVLEASEYPHGMIITVGPTGSGKTTVLYTIVEKVNAPEVNIMTIEDPVEYSIEGVQQTQVNTKKNLTFANGLRSIVRQDPDIIMVGEIRDTETADIAINSALTGHLVISTLHANDAATTFPRLTEMNVEPFLIASSVNVVVALRLVRKICSHCKMSYVISATEQETLNQNSKLKELVQAATPGREIEQLRLYRGKGCKSCHQTGFSGRTGIFEVLLVDDNIRVLITKRASADEINNQALASGMTSMLEDGIIKVLNGVTTLEEVIKVAGTA